MTVKEQAHQLLDQLPDHVTWADLLKRLEQAARRLGELSGATRQSVAAPEPGSNEHELRKFLEREIWPQIPADVLGTSIAKSEREAILGYGSEGV